MAKDWWESAPVAEDGNWWEAAPLADAAPAEPVRADLGDPSGAGLGAAIMDVATPKRSSVLEGRKIPDLPFDPVEAERLTNRAYAENALLPDDPRNRAPALAPSRPRPADTSKAFGERIADVPLPVRAGVKAVLGGAQALGGITQAVGDFTGLNSVADFGATAASNAQSVQQGMGQVDSIEGFGPKSPAPYLANMAEGAASSVVQSALAGAAFGPAGVIPALSVMTAGQEYNKARQAGSEPFAALANAVPKGAFEAFGEKFSGLDRVTGALGTLLQKGVSADAKRTASEELLRAGIREVPGEVITYLGQTGVDLVPGIGINPDLTVSQFLDGLRDTVVQASLTGGALGVGSAALRQRPVQPAAPSLVNITPADSPTRQAGLSDIVVPVGAEKQDTALPPLPAPPPVAPPPVAPDSEFAATLAQLDAANPPVSGQIQPLASTITAPVATNSVASDAVSNIERLLAPQGAANVSATVPVQAVDSGVGGQPAAEPVRSAGNGAFGLDGATGQLGTSAGAPAPGSASGVALRTTSTGQDAVGEPLTIWTGRRGDGYTTANDASLALPSRQRNQPELDWRIEAMPSGKFRLAGYAEPSATLAREQNMPQASAVAAADAIENVAVGFTPEAYRQLAAERAGNPDYFNADLAKELDPKYAASNESRRANSEATQKKAAVVRDAAFNERLAQPPKPGETVTFMAGGTGSGKSTTTPQTGIVFDSTLGKQTPAQAFELVDRVLASGREVRVNYVFTEPTVALQRALGRAQDIGRGLSLETHAKTHQVANETVRAIQDRYAGDVRVKVRSFDNTGAGPVPLEKIPAYDYNETRAELQSTLDAELKSGAIDEALYRTFAGTGTDRSEIGTRAGAGAVGQVGSEVPDGRGPRAYSLAPVDDPGATAQPSSVLTPAPDSPQTPATAGVSVSADRFPSVESVGPVPFGPSSITPRVIARDKPLYRETNTSGLDDLLRGDAQAEYRPVFVSDNPDLALGQGDNKGISITFRPNALSGRENVKPGTGDVAGREYQADIVAPRAVQSITFAYPKQVNLARGLTRRVLQQEFTRTDLPDGRVQFVRNGLESAAPPAPPAPTKPTLTYTRQRDGTVLVKGPKAAIKAALPDITGIAGRSGVTFGKSRADAVVAVLDTAAAPAAPGSDGVQAAGVGATADGAPGSDAGNGFKQGPKKGERYRVGVVESVGGAVAIEKRLPAGTAATFYVGKDGSLIDGDAVNLVGTRDRDRLWVPKNKEQADQASGILDEMGKLPLDDPKRADAKQRLKALVAADQAEQPDAATQRREFAESEAKRTASGARLRSNASSSNPFRAFLGKHGVSADVAAEFVPGAAERKRALVPGYGPIFRKTGKALDQLAADAVEEGFLTSPDEGQLYDLIERAIRGERVIAQYAEGVAESEGQALVDRQRMLEEDAITDAQALSDASIFDFEENDADIAWDAIGSNATTEQAMRALGFTEEEIQDAEIANEPRRAQEGDAGPDQSEQAIAGEAPGNRAQGDPAPGPAAEDLTAPSRADIEAQQDRAARADELDQRAQIDREAGGFDLQSQTEESRTDNTGDMFGGPSAEDVLAERGRRKPKPDDGGPDLFSDAPKFSRAPAPVFYSELSRKIEAGPNQAMPDQWRAYINGLTTKGVKPDEIAWSGVNDWLQLQTGKVTKASVREYLDANGVKVEEVVLGEGGDALNIATRQANAADNRASQLFEQLDRAVPPMAGVNRANLPWWASEAAAGDKEAESKLRAIVPAEAFDLAIEYGQARNESVEAAQRAREARLTGSVGKYRQYAVPGGENYRELLLTLPVKREVNPAPAINDWLKDQPWYRSWESRGRDMQEAQSLYDQWVEREAKGFEKPAFRSNHWDQPNVVAHIRIDDRTDADGKRVLFINEIQSDWGQQGKKSGFRKAREINPTDAEIIEYFGLKEGANPDEYRQEMIDRERRIADNQGVPPAPFVTKTEAWVSLALKRAIAYAAQNGYDKVAMVTGEQAAGFFDLSKQIDTIAYGKSTDGKTASIDAVKDGRNIFSRSNVPLAEIEGLLGKEVASKIERGEGETNSTTGYTELSGLDLQVGGEGMKAFYDKIVPTVAKDVLRKVGGGQIGDVLIQDEQSNKQAENDDSLLADLGIDSPPASRITLRQPGFDITPAMREKIASGLPLFSREQAGPSPGLSRTQFSDAMAAAFGKSVAGRLEQKGVVVAVQRQSELPDRMTPFLRDGDTVFGAYDPVSDKTYVVLENINEGMVRELALHEIGVHYGFKRMLGQDKYDQVLRRVDLMRRAGNPAAKDAYLNAKNNAARERDVPEETLAYLVQNAPESSLVQDIIARIKAFLFKEFGIGASRLTEADLVALARAAVLHSSRAEPGGVALPQQLVNFSLSSSGNVKVQAIGDKWVVARKARNGGEDHLGYFNTQSEAEAAAVSERESARVNTKRARGNNARWWIENPAEPIQSAGQRRLDSLGRSRARQQTLDARWESIRSVDEADGLQQIPDRAGWCFSCAAEASAAELGDMVIGASADENGAPIWHAVIMRDGAVYDPTFGRWFEPGVYEELGFKPALTLTTDDVRSFIERTGGLAPDARNQGLGDAPAFSRNSSQTESAEFKRWFGDSKVVDADGRPLVVYHGTRSDISAIDIGKSERLTGFWMTPDPKVASTYAAQGVVNASSYSDGANVMPLYAKVEKPYRYDPKKKPMYMAWQEYQDGDYDGFLEMSPDGGVASLAVKAAASVKSAIGNNGQFDPANADIRFSRSNGTPTPKTPKPRSKWLDATGRLQFAPGQALYDMIGSLAKPLLNKLELKSASPELTRQLRKMKLDVQTAQETAVAVAGETAKLSPDERQMVSDIIEKELAAGVTPPEHAVRLAAVMNQAMAGQTDELVRLGMLTKDSADRWRDAYLPRFYEQKLGKQVGDAWADALRRVTGRTSAMKGIRGKHLRGRGMYETIPVDQLENYETMGWEVRDPEYDAALANPELDGSGPQTVQVWRDFSRQERDKMGEIRDAGFRFVMGYMQTQRDIALGRMFEGLANNSEMSSRTEQEGYVEVPTTKVPGTGALRYGKLSGRFVPQEVMSQLSQVEESQSEAWQMYRQAMGLWKEGKTVLNPVSHVNNMVGNMTMAHLAGVSYHRADKYMAAMRDFAKKSPNITEAKEAGLFLGTMSDAELFNTLPKDLQLLAQMQESSAKKAGRSAFNLMTFYLRKPMGWAYQAEDTFFRYLIYKDARDQGLDANDAVDYAQKYIFTYDDLPKGARRVRDFAVPFFAYTYKAVPALLHTALTHPGRMAAPAAVLWGINAAAYAIAAGDDDDKWWDTLQRYLKDPEFRAKAREQEQLERENLPPWMKGTTALMTPKTIRLGMDEVTKLPLFMDMSRMIPGGDMFDVSPNAGGVPLPQPITPSHPLFTTAVAMLGNKDMFFGKELVDKNDTREEATEKRLGWIWRQFSPAIAAGNYHWERGMNALAQASGGEIEWLPDVIADRYTGVGRDGLPVQPGLAAAQTFGIKIRPIDIDKAEQMEGGQRAKMIRDIDTEIRQLQRLNKLGALSDRALDKERDRAIEKKDRLREGLTVDGEARK